MGEGRAIYHSPTNQKNLTTFTVWDERARGDGCLGCVVPAMASEVLSTISVADMISVLSVPLDFYSFIFLCSVFSWSDTLVLGIILLISLVVSPIAYLTL